MASAADVLQCSLFFLLVVTCATEGINSLIGEACGIDKNCISLQMVCSSTRNCECMRGHYSTEDRRNCIATTSGLCYENSDCRSLPSSSCFILDNLEGSCSCADGYSSSEDERECLPDVGYQETCREAVQCASRLGYNAVCREGRCGCQTKYHYSAVNGRCIGDVRLLEACVNASQCVTSNQNSRVECRDNRCSCPEGYEQIQDYCRAGGQNVIISLSAFLLYWVVKFVIT